MIQKRPPLRLGLVALSLGYQKLDPDSGRWAAGAGLGGQQEQGLEKQVFKRQRKGNIKETCWGSQRGEQLPCVGGFVQLGSSLGKLQRATAFAARLKRERGSAQRHTQGAMFSASPGNLGPSSAILIPQV